MSNGRRIVQGRQVDRRQLARTPVEARANMEVIDLAASKRRQAAKAKDEAQTTEQPSQQETGELKATEERSEQETQDQSSVSTKQQSETVRIRYHGSAGRFRIAGYAFTPGDIRQVRREHAEEILTYPYERFTLVEE